MDLVTSLICILIILFLTWRWRWTSQFQKLGIPGPKPSLIFGNILELYRKGPIQCHEEWVKKYGRVLGYYYGMKPVLLIADSHLIKNIFIRDFSKFMNREPFDPLKIYTPHDAILQNVAFLPGQAWKDTRSTITPTFTTSKMKQMYGIMNSSLMEIQCKLYEFSEKDEEFDIYKMFQILSFDIITRTAMGIRTDAQTNPNSPALRRSKAIFDVSFYNKINFIGLSFPSWVTLCVKLRQFLEVITNRGELLRTLLDDRIMEVLQFRRENSQIKYSDLLQLMIDAKVPFEATQRDASILEAGNIENEKKLDKQDNRSKATKTLTDWEIVCNAVALLLAGFETSSTMLAYITYLLAKHQDVQEKLFDEILELTKSGQELEFEAVNKLQYLDKVVCESLRLYPPVILFQSRYALENVQYGDLKIPKGTLVTAPLYLLHHDPEYWAEPETFDPERFSQKVNQNGIYYMPFGAGPRNCIGMRFSQLEMKLTIAKLIHKFQVNLGERNKSGLKIRHNVRTMVPREGVYVRLVRRQS